MQQRSLSILSQQTALYVTTNAWANIPQYIITATEDGDYDISANAVIDCDTAGDTTFLRFAINGNAIGGTLVSTTANGHAQIFPFYNSINNIALKTDDVISLQAVYGGSATNIYFSVGTAECSLQIIKRGV